MPKGEHNSRRGPKRSKDRREADLTVMVQLLRRGVTRREAARQLGVHESQVSYDWKKLLKQLREERGYDARAHKDVLLEQILEVRAEAWKAWDHSNARMLEEVTRQVYEQVMASVQATGELPKGVSVKLKSNPPADYLRAVLESIREEGKLEDLYPAARTDNKNENVNSLRVDWDTLVRQLPPGALEDTVEKRLAAVEALPAPSPPPPEPVTGDVPSDEVESGDGNGEAPCRNGFVELPGPEEADREGG